MVSLVQSPESSLGRYMPSALDQLERVFGLLPMNVSVNSPTAALVVGICTSINAEHTSLPSIHLF